MFYIIIRYVIHRSYSLSQFLTYFLQISFIVNVPSFSMLDDKIDHLSLLFIIEISHERVVDLLRKWDMNQFVKKMVDNWFWKSCFHIFDISSFSHLNGLLFCLWSWCVLGENRPFRSSFLIIEIWSIKPLKTNGLTSIDITRYIVRNRNMGLYFIAILRERNQFNHGNNLLNILFFKRNIEQNLNSIIEVLCIEVFPIINIMQISSYNDIFTLFVIKLKGIIWL